MRIRLSGTAAEVEQGVDLIRDVFDVHSVSPRYSSRNQVCGVRVYIDATLYDQNAREYDRSAPRCPWCRLTHIVDFHGRAGAWGMWACRRCARMYGWRGDEVRLAQRPDAAPVLSGDYLFTPTGLGWQRVTAVDAASGAVQLATSPAWVRLPERGAYVLRGAQS